MTGGTVGRMTRTCAKPGCSVAATSTLEFAHAAGEAWLDELSAEVRPHGYDLCSDHADRLTVPRGWMLHDLRGDAPTLFRAEAS